MCALLVFVLSVVCCCVYVVAADCCLCLSLCDAVVCRMVAAIGFHRLFLCYASIVVVSRHCCLLLL